MLYDPKWQKTADTLTLPALIAWLELQPADETYSYVNTSTCLIAQYLNAHGIQFISMGTTRYCDVAGVEHAIHPVFNRIANGTDHGDLNTFGRALARARKARA